jgi:excisionase family DNA binding protein
MQEQWYFTIRQFAKLLQVHPMTIRRAVKRGKIGHINIGTEKKPLYRIPHSEINRIALFDLEAMIDRIMRDRSL